MRKREVVYGITEAPNTDALSRGERIPWVGFIAKSRFGGAKKFLWWRNFSLKSGCQTTCEQLFWRFGIEAQVGPALDLDSTRKIGKVCLIEDCRIYGIYIEEKCRPGFNFFFGIQRLREVANPGKIILREWKGCGGAFTGFDPDIPYSYQQSCWVKVQCTKCRKVEGFSCRCSGQKVRSPNIFNWKENKQKFICKGNVIRGGVLDICGHKKFKVKEIKPSRTTRFIEKTSEGQASIIVECTNCKKGRQIRPLSGARFVHETYNLGRLQRISVDKWWEEGTAKTIWYYEIAYKEQQPMTDSFVCQNCGRVLEPSPDFLKLFKVKERGFVLEYEWECPSCKTRNERAEYDKYGLEEDEKLTWDHLGVFTCPECGSFKFRVIESVFWITAEEVEAALGD